MPIQLYSASAGSGKTYNLALFYLKIALSQENNFRQIVAITFTNAAANEMKERILKYLFELSKNTADKNLKSTLLQSLNLTETALQKRAYYVLNRIIQNYSQFAVYTIDSFLQRLFKGVLYELNIRYNYDLVVNNSDLIDKSIAQFLFNIDEHDESLYWLTHFIENQVENEKAVNYHPLLNDLANEINKEFFYQYEEKFNTLRSDDFKQWFPALDVIQKNFIAQLKVFHAEFLELMQKSGLSIESFSQGERGVGGFLGKKIVNFNKGKNISYLEFNSYVIKAKQDTEHWIAKTKTKEQQLFLPWADNFYALLNKTCDFIDHEGKRYQTAVVLAHNLFNIAVISYISQNLKSYKADNNSVLLSDITKVLKDFIKENYLFIYEKTGVRYQYFLIDEFQDTSRIQYDVLKPLIEECISKTEASSVMIVGDVKQAIYRWRNGDWTLMQNNLPADFKQQIQSISLNDNWRSMPVIIHFNNALIKNIEKSENAAVLYSDVLQQYPNSKTIQDFEGYVKVMLFKKAAKQKEEMAEEDESEDISKNNWFIPEIKQLWQKGIKNIGILVRTNREASEVFRLLLSALDIQDEEFNIISKESIAYQNSSAVSLLVSIIQYMNQPTDYLKYLIGYYYAQITNAQPSDYTKVFEEFCSLYPDINQYYDYPLFEKVTSLVYSLKNSIPDSEQVFVYHFLQLLKNYTAQNPANDAAFVDWYEQKGKYETLKISGQKTGVHILTIHKSKGLEFDAVLIPSINWSKNNKSEYQWFSKPDAIYDESSVPAFLIKTNGELENSFFKDEYLAEKNKKEIDDLNLLYVAITRARHVLMMGVEEVEIGKKIHQLFEKGFTVIVNGNEKPIANFRINTHDENCIAYEVGNMEQYKPSACKEITETIHFSDEYKLFNYKLAVRENEQWSSNKSIAHGNLIHEILSKITNEPSRKEDMSRVFAENNIAYETQQEVQQLLSHFFAQRPEIESWFKNAKEIISERTVFSNGKMYRPDKIFIFDDKTILVDFKTGTTPLESYKGQLLNYKQLLRQMNYPQIESYLVNIDSLEMLKL